MRNDEFFGTNEQYNAREFKHFPAELYRSPSDFNLSSPEIGERSAESFHEEAHPPKGGTFTPDKATPTTAARKKEAQTKEGKRRSAIKRIINKVTEGLSSVGGSIASTVAVAATAVVLSVSTLTAAPDVAVLSVEAGADYVSYEFEIDNLSNEMDYEIILTDGKDERIFPVFEGVVKNTVTDLIPNYRYTLMLVGNDTMGRTVYYKTPVYTEKNGFIREQLSVSLGTPHLVNTSEFLIPFTISGPTNGALQYSEVVFDIDLGDGVIQSERVKVSGGGAYTLSLTLEPFITQVNVTATLAVTNAAGESLTVQSTHALDLPYQLRLSSPSIIPDESAIELAFLKHSPENAMIEIQNFKDGSTEFYYNNTATVSLDENSDTQTVRYRLVDEEGNPLTEFTELTLPTRPTNAGDTQYEFSYLNPGNIPQTYNRDGSINLYFPLGFTAENPNVYYVIYYFDYEADKNYEFISRDPNAVLYNLRNASYTIIYDVVLLEDNVRHVLRRTAVSGSTTVNPQPSLKLTLAPGTTTGTTVRFLHYADTKISGTCTLTLNQTTTVTFDASELTYLADEGVYEFTYLADFDVTEASLTVQAAINYHRLESALETLPLVGNPYQWHTVTAQP